MKVLLLLLAAILVSAASAMGQDVVGDVHLSARDIDLKEAYGLCRMHPGPVVNGVPMNGEWWPQPCDSVIQEWVNSGAAERYAKIEWKSQDDQLNAVREILKGSGK